MDLDCKLSARRRRLELIVTYQNETLNCIFMFFSTLNALLGPAIAYGETHSNPCGYWLVAFYVGVSVRVVS